MNCYLCKKFLTDVNGYQVGTVWSCEKCLDIVKQLADENRIKNEILDVMLDDFSKSFSKKILNHSDFQNIVDQVLMKKIDPEQAAMILKKRLNYE